MRRTTFLLMFSCITAISYVIFYLLIDTKIHAGESIFHYMMSAFFLLAHIALAIILTISFKIIKYNYAALMILLSVLVSFLVVKWIAKICLFLLLFAYIIFSVSFGSGKNMSEDQMKKFLMEKKEKFELLNNEVLNAKKEERLSIRHKGFIDSLSDTSKDEPENIKSIRKLMKPLHIESIQAYDKNVDYFVFGKGFATTSSVYKGYLYSENEPEVLLKDEQTIKNYLKSIDIRGGYEVYKRIQENWYLYEIYIP